MAKKTSMIDFGMVNTAIIVGELDDYLDVITQACHNRKRIKGQNLGRELRVGDRVTCQGLRPAYVNGHPATVVRVLQTKALIRFDGGAGRFQGECRCPLSALVRIEEKTKGKKNPKAKYFQ